MNRLEPLNANQTYAACDPTEFAFDTTAEVADSELPCGQDRALRALAFGTGIVNHGFNLIVVADPGTDQRDLVRRFLGTEASTAAVPDDWCYAFNFDDARQPRTIRLPAGLGRRLRSDLESLISELGTAIPAAFDSEDYQGRLHELQDHMAQQQHAGIRAVHEEALEHDIALLSTPAGFTFAPLENGEVLDPERYQKLPKEERARIEATIEDLQRKLQQTLQHAPRMRKTLLARIRELDEETLAQALDGIIDEVEGRWKEQAAVCTHLEAIRKDLVGHAEVLRNQQDRGPLEPLLSRYQINLLVDNGDTSGAPVILEDLPSHQHLVGLTEHYVQQGTLHTDFSLIRSGALHRANGGYLILDLRQVLGQPMAWPTLKRVLMSGEIRVESIEHQYGLASTVSLQPQPIPLQVKVVLLGERRLHALLTRLDPDVQELFKVEVDLENALPRTEDNRQRYARMLATLSRRHNLPPLSRSGVARMIEQSSRMAEDQTRLTARDREVVDLLVEAGHWANRAGDERIEPAHVDQALAERRERVGRIQRQSLELIQRGVLLIATEGSRIGQVNGLSVLQLSRYAFGRPGRITATATPGRGDVVDIEREVELGGPIHSKGVMILSRYISSRYGGDAPLSLSASLAFEQSYGGIDGDSASVAETCALLSALARVPLRQALAITGSINQFGDVQAIGGINEKVEGFFDVCEQVGGIDGRGVILPVSNMEHLMLRADVRTAVAEQRFHLYAVSHVDEALALLTDAPVGEADASGQFPADTVNRRVVDRLAEFARQRRLRESADHDSNGPSP